MSIINSEYTRLLNLELVIIPITNIYLDKNNKKKVNFVDGWNNFNLDDSKKFKDKSKKGIAIKCGKINNLIVFDIDSTDQFFGVFNKDIEDYIKEIKTPIVKTRKGYHLYFKYDPEFDKKIININELKFDLLTDQCCCICPPTSYSTYNYQWIYDISTPLIEIPKGIKDFILLHNTNKIEKVPKNINKFEFTTNNNNKIKIILDNLSESYYNNYDKWLNILIALKNTNEEYIEMANEFSMKSDKYNESEFYDKWESIKNNHNNPLTINSIYHWLKEDNIELYNSLQLICPNFDFNDTVKMLTKVNDIEIINYDKTGYNFTGSGTCTCGIITDTYKLYVISNDNNKLRNMILKCTKCNGKKIAMMCDIENLGILSKELNIDIKNAIIVDNIIYLSSEPDITFNIKSTKLSTIEDEKYLISNKKVNLLEDLSYLFPNKYNVTTNKWILDVEDNNKIKIKGEDPTQPSIELIGDLEIPNKVKFRGSVGQHMSMKPFNVNKNEVKSICNHINNAISQYLRNDIGMTIINNNTIIINNEAEIKINEVELVDILESKKLLDDFIIESDNLIYRYDYNSKLWETRTSKEVGKTIINIFKNECSDLITDPNDKFFKSSNNFLKTYITFVSDETRNKRDKQRVTLLDNNPNLFPFKNAVYDLQNDILRDITRDDYLTLTTGYDIRPIEYIPKEEFDIVNSYYEKIFPNQEEREYFKILVASCLPKSSCEKILVILTDQRQGFNGKTSIMESVREVFGDYLSCDGDPSLLVESNEGINSHGAGFLKYKNKRLTFIEESDSSKQLAAGRIKKITGGGKNRFSARRFMSGIIDEFQWTATPFVTCNDSEFGKLRATDSALLDRLKVVPFRSRFENIEEDDNLTNTYKINKNIKNKVDNLQDVHFYILLESYRKYKLNGLPKDTEYSKLFKHSLICSSDSLYGSIIEYIDENIKKVDDNSKFIQMKEIIENFRNSNIQYNNKRIYKQRDIEKLFVDAMKFREITHKSIKKINNKQFKNVYINIEFKL